MKSTRFWIGCFLASAALAQAPEVWPGRRLAEALLERQPEDSAYVRFLRGYTAIIDICRQETEPALLGTRILGTVDRIMADPLSLVDEVQVLAEPVERAGDDGDLPGEIAALARGLDIPGLDAEPLPETPGPEGDLETWLDFYEKEILEIKKLRDKAFAGVPREQQHFLSVNARLLFDVLRQTVYIEYAREDIRAKLLGVLLLSKDVDFRALLQAGRRAGHLLSRQTLKDLKKGLAEAPRDRELRHEGVEGGLVAVRQTAAGPIILGSRDNNTYSCEAALIIDLGGADTYVDRPGRVLWDKPSKDPMPSFVSLIADLSGNDRYQVSDTAKVFVSQGGAVLGVAGMADLDGKDSYVGGRFSQGTGLYGVGFLADYGGDDVYAGTEFCQGAGAFGLGLLHDRDGHDSYRAHLYSQAAGFVLGIGCLSDRRGNDRFYATGVYPSTYGEGNEFHAMSQGVGVGFRGYPKDGSVNFSGGGIGLLLDGGGQDRMEAGEFGLGCGYYFGLGAVITRGGDDHYTGARYGIATGAHQGLSCFIDWSGHDTYKGRAAANVGGNWDGMNSAFWDVEGDDRYDVKGLALGGATITSLAIFLDSQGQDSYTARGRALGSGGHEHDAKRQSYCIGIFMDHGGQSDRYDVKGDDEGPARDNGSRFRRAQEMEGRVVGWGIFEDK